MPLALGAAVSPAVLVALVALLASGGRPRRAATIDLVLGPYLIIHGVIHL